jgi:hypothetical protein
VLLLPPQEPGPLECRCRDACSSCTPSPGRPQAAFGAALRAWLLAVRALELTTVVNPYQPPAEQTEPAEPGTIELQWRGHARRAALALMLGLVAEVVVPTAVGFVLLFGLLRVTDDLGGDPLDWQERFVTVQRFLVAGLGLVVAGVTAEFVRERSRPRVSSTQSWGRALLVLACLDAAWLLILAMLSGKVPSALGYVHAPLEVLLPVVGMMYLSALAHAAGQPNRAASARRVAGLLLVVEVGKIVLAEALTPVTGYPSAGYLAAVGITALAWLAASVAALVLFWRLRQELQVVEGQWWFQQSAEPQPLWLALLAFPSGAAMAVAPERRRLNFPELETARAWLEQQGYVPGEDAQRRGLVDALPPPLLREAT